MTHTSELTYATVCSGIECMSVACLGLPMRPVFFSEIEPFPCAVLKAHYPDVPNLGDMSKIQVSGNGKEITNGTTRLLLDARLDILAGGTPCQDVSVAGKRAGMQEGSGTRSSLAFDFVRLARELQPRWIIWENVAGSIDSKNAPDFLRFASALGDCGYTLAWRVLDAQYVRVDGMERAVPQRRRRVWVVGYSGADESIPAQILFEPDCVAGNTPPRRRTGQGFAYSLAGCDRVDARMVEGAPGAVGFEPGIARREGGANRFTVETASTLRSHMGDNQPSAAIALEGNGQRPSHLGSGISTEGAQFTLNRIEHHGVAYESKCFENHGQDSRIKPIEVSDTRNQKDGTGGNNLPLVCFSKVSHASAPNGEGERWDEREVAPTLSHQPSALEPTLAQSQCDISQMRYIVRHLTPTECERLMGLPDGHTIPTGLRRFFDANGEPAPELVSEFVDIFDTFNAIMADYAHTKPPKGKSYNQVAAWMKKIADPATCPDSPRYKGCGNGWATNQPRWILTRMLSMEGIEW